MGDTVKIRHLRAAAAPRRPTGPAAQEGAVRNRLDHVVEDVKLALLTTGLSLEGETNRGQDPYNSRPKARSRDAWSDHKRRR
jgi:hypothetical protein